MIEFPPRLQLARLPTPFQKLERLSEQIGRNIWIKRDDLSESVSAGNKIRKLEFTLAKAQSKDAQVLITCGGVQSNHCRATAMLGAALGFKVHLILRGEQPQEFDGNLFLDQLAGAKCSYFSPRYYNTNFDFIRSSIEEEYRVQGQATFFIPTGASDATGVWGYVQASNELAVDFKQAEIDPSRIFHATGSGGTQAGLSVGSYLNQLCSVTGMAVCDSSEYFQNKVREDLDSWKLEYSIDIDLDQVEIDVNDSYIGKGYAKASPEVFATIERVARLEGIVLDPVYSGKAFHGMLSELEAGSYQGSDFVFIHTGGIFGLFAQRHEYLNASSYQ